MSTASKQMRKAQLQDSSRQVDSAYELKLTPLMDMALVSVSSKLIRLVPDLTELAGDGSPAGAVPEDGWCRASKAISQRRFA